MTTLPETDAADNNERGSTLQSMTDEATRAFRAAHHAAPHCNNCGIDLPTAHPELGFFCSPACWADFYDNVVLVREADGTLVAYLKPEDIEQVRSLARELR